MVKKEFLITALLFVASLLAGFFVFFPIADGDIFWHLASGREILTRGHFLRADPFSFTTPEIQWIDIHWLFQVLVYLIFSMSGYYGLLFFKSMVIAGSVFLLLSSCRSHSSKVITTSLFLFSFYQCRYLVPLRPGVLTLFYLSTFIFLLEQFQQTSRIRFLIPLIPLQVLWINTQGLFMIGPIVYALHMLGAATDSIVSEKTLKILPAAVNKKNTLIIIIFILLCVAGVITPYGVKGLLFPFRLFIQITPGTKNLYSNLIAENTPLFKMIGTDQEFYVITFTILVATALISIILAGKKTRFAHVYIFLCFTGLAIMAQRNLILFLVAVTPLLQANLSNLHFKSTFKFNRFLLYGLIMIMTFYFTTVTALHLSMIQSVKNPISPFCHPVESTHYLKKHQINGTIFNADRYGGYLIWHLFPSHKVYIDTRLSMRDRSFFTDYINLLNSPQQFETARKNYDIAAVVIPVHIPLYLNLTRYLSNDPEWAMVHCDGSEVLFIRRDQQPEGIINLHSSIDLNSLFEAVNNSPQLKSPALKKEALARLRNFVLNLGP